MKTQDVIQVFSQSFAQASATAVFVMALALLAAIGLVRLGESKARNWLEILFAIPSFLPTIFIIVCALKLFDLIGTAFPIGISGIVIVNVFFMTGFVTVVIARMLNSELNRFSDLAWVEGASKFLFWKTALVLVKERLLLLLAYVFISAFSSFGIPFIVGGVAGETIDVFVYRLAFARGDWIGAIWLALAQMVFLFLMSLAISKSEFIGKPSLRQFRIEWGYLPGLIPVILIATAIVVGGMDGLIPGLNQLAQNPQLQHAVLLATYGTTLQCLSAIGFFILLFCGCLWIWPSAILLRILRGFAAPSTALCGLALYLLWPGWLRSSDITLVAVGFGFLILIFSSIYRLRGESVLRQLEPQIEVAQILGARRHQIFFEIMWPQVRPDVLWMAGLVGLWTAGDFAFAMIVLEQDRTLAIVAQTLLGGYRLDLATAVVWLLMLVGSTLFFILAGWGNVDRQKLVS